MNAAGLESAVWGAVAVVFAGLMVLAVFLFGRGDRRRGRRVWVWGVLALALLLSGPVVRGLVHLWTATLTLRVVPGAVATWAPAVGAAIGLGLLLLRRGPSRDLGG